MSDDLWVMEPGKGSRVLELGATRQDILRRLAAARFEIDDDEEDEEYDEVEDHWVYVDEIDAELTFTAGANSTLQEIVMTDERVRLGPIEVIDEPLGEILELLKVANEETLWTFDGHDRESSASGDPTAVGNLAAESPSDAELLKGGTLWILPFGVGLDLVYGDVLTLKLRKPGDVPPSAIGPLTPAQRELANRDDLSATLFRSTQQPIASPIASRFQRFAGFALMIVLGLIVWSAIDYQRRWQDAPVALGSVVAVKPPPPEPFPEEYTVVYFDTAKVRHEVVLQRNDVYVTPKIGETVEIRYLPEAPDEPLGPARVNDIAMEKYVPWGIGVITAYLILQFVAAFSGLILRKAMTAALAPTKVDVAS
jgi:hypothetical protein